MGSPNTKTSKPPKPDWSKLGESDRPQWTNPKAPPVDTKREKHREFKI